MTFAIALAALLIQGCASVYRVTPYPLDAQISIRNPVTKRVFQVGKGALEFKPKPEYGEAFILVASRPGYMPRNVLVSRNSGGSDYILNLRPNDPKLGELDPALNDAIEDQIKRKVDSLLQEAELNLRKAEEQRREAFAEKLRYEMKNRALDSEKKLGVLENTFDVYKDALFSERYARSPASFDRNRIDLTVDLVNRIQESIEHKNLTEASTLVDRLLERDEYFAKGHALKGTVRYLQGRIGDAVRSWERALEIDPLDKATQHFLSIAYRKQGRAPATRAKGSFAPASGKFDPNQGFFKPASAGAGSSKW